MRFQESFSRMLSFRSYLHVTYTYSSNSNAFIQHQSSTSFTDLGLLFEHVLALAGIPRSSTTASCSQQQ